MTDSQCLKLGDGFNFLFGSSEALRSKWGGLIFSDGLYQSLLLSNDYHRDKHYADRGWQGRSKSLRLARCGPTNSQVNVKIRLLFLKRSSTHRRCRAILQCPNGKLSLRVTRMHQDVLLPYCSYRIPRTDLRKICRTEHNVSRIRNVAILIRQTEKLATLESNDHPATIETQTTHRDTVIGPKSESTVSIGDALPQS